MKKTVALILSFTFVLLFLASCSEQDQQVDTQVGDGIFSSFTAVDIDGNIVSQKIFAEHKVTMINIWGTFCGPCIKEMPDLAALNREYSDQGFQVIGIPLDVLDRNLEKIPDKIVEMHDIIDATGADYRHILNSKSLHEAYLSEVQSMPVTIFVNSEGCIIGSPYMGAKSKTFWENVIKAMLESSK